MVSIDCCFPVTVNSGDVDGGEVGKDIITRTTTTTATATIATP